MYRFLVSGWSAKPLASADDRIVGTHTHGGQRETTEMSHRDHPGHA